MRLGNTWEVAAREIAQWGSYHFGKYHWEIATWEKSFGKVPNIESTILYIKIGKYVYKIWKKGKGSIYIFLFQFFYLKI